MDEQIRILQQSLVTKDIEISDLRKMVGHLSRCWAAKDRAITDLQAELYNRDGWLQWYRMDRDRLLAALNQGQNMNAKGDPTTVSPSSSSGNETAKFEGLFQEV